MPVLAALRRLLGVRELEEEQAQKALEASLSELKRLEFAYAGAVERERRGRAMVATGVQSGALADRLAGMEETRQARRTQAALEPRRAEAESTSIERRETLLAKRAERRQVEILIQDAEAREALDNRRREQQDLDDWYLGKRRRSGGRSGINDPAVSSFETEKP